MISESALAIFGAGGHGRVCAEVAIAAGYRVVAFCDSNPDIGPSINGIKTVTIKTVTDLTKQFDASRTALFVAIGDNDRRMKLVAEAESLGFALPTLLHPSAVISPTAEIGGATVVVANSVVNANARVGKGCILNTACSIDHDNVLEEGVQISPGVRSAGNVYFGERAFIGTGAILVPGVKVGREAHIAAGTLVATDVGAGERVRQFPARPAPT